MIKKFLGKIEKKGEHLFSLLHQVSLQFLVVGLIMFAALLALFYTNPGAKLTIGLVNVFLKKPIYIQEIEGTLAGSLTLRKVRFDNEAIKLSAEIITAHWAPDAIHHIRKGLSIKQLKIENLNIHYHNNHEHWLTEIPSLEELKKHLKKLIKYQIKIEDFQAHQIVLHLGQKPIPIQSITFTRGGSHQNHLFKTLNIQAQQGALSFDQSDHHIRLKWNLKVDELNPFITALKGDIFTQGHLVLHDLNQIDSDTVLKLQLKAKQLSYQDHTLQNLLVRMDGKLEKHDLSIRGKFKDNQIEAAFVGKLDKSSLSNWQADIKNLLIHTPKFGKLPPSTGKIQIQVDKQKQSLASNLTLNILGKNITTAEFKIDNHFNQLSGHIQSYVVDLDFLRQCFPILEDIHGHALLTLNLKGELFNPLIWGGMTLKECRIDSSDLSNLSTRLYLSELKLDSMGDGKLNIIGHGTLGKGRFTIEGKSDFTQNTPLVDLYLKGKNLTLSQTPEYFILADPSLHLQLKNKIPYLSGTIFIPEAEIETQAFGGDTLEPSHDMVIINDQPSSTTPTQKQPMDYASALNTHINIELGDKIRYKGFGLESHVAGKLNIFTQNANLHARGKLLLVDGKYRVHGNVLNIQHGHIAFLGDQITNPSWDIRAVKQIYTPIQNKLFRAPKKQQDTVFFESEDNKMVPYQPILVGVSLKGTVQHPILKMFSIPTLKEADIISYLVLNKPQRDASEAQTTLVLEAVNELIHFLGNKRHDVKLDLAKNLKLDKFGLNQIAGHTPGQNDLEKTALVIGKQLSNKLYAEYSLRVLDRASTLSLRYLVGKHIVLEGSASKDSASGDILFTFESG